MVKMKIINYQLGEDLQSAGLFVDERLAHRVDLVCYDGTETSGRTYHRILAPDPRLGSGDSKRRILESLDSCKPLEVKVI